MLRIAIDIRDLQIAKTGAKTYLEELCHALPKVAPQHTFIFLQPAWQLPKGKTVLHKILGHVAFFWWKEIELPLLAWLNNCDIIFCTDYTVPLFSSAKTIPVFHDANFWANPQQYNRIWRLLITIFAVSAAKKSACVVTVSNFSRKEIVKYTHIPQEKIIPIPNAPKTATHTQLSSEETKHILKKYNLNPNIPIILHVGVLEKRKNLPRLIQAFAQFLNMVDNLYQLVLVGQPGPKKNLDDSVAIKSTIQQLKLHEHVHLSGYIADEDLAALYQSASIFAFPSLREGFGIPVLEAFHHDVPVMASNSSALPEVVGDAALLFDPLDITMIAETMFQLATDHALRQQLMERSKQQTQLYTWEKTAQQLVELFESVV